MNATRRSALAAAVALIVVPTLTFAYQWITIGSWNIENLGERTHGQSPKALAEHLTIPSLAILALQEIHATDGNASTPKNTKLDATFAELNQSPGQQWTYILFPNKDPEDKSQLCGVARKTSRVEKIGEPFRIPVVDNLNDDFNAWDRPPHAVKFRIRDARNDLVVIPCI